jgi:hypothetical protein
MFMLPPTSVSAGRSRVVTLAIALVHADTGEVYATPAIDESWRDADGRIIVWDVLLE